MHTEVVYSTLGNDWPGLDVRDRNVDGTAKQREEQQGKDEVGAEADPFIGVADEANLNENEQENQEEKEANNKESRQWKEIEATHRIFLPHLSADVSIIAERTLLKNLTLRSVKL